jgi:hypothetical protein
MDKIRLAVVVCETGLLPWQKRLLERIKQDQNLNLDLALELPAVGNAGCSAAGWPQRALERLAKLEAGRLTPKSLMKRTAVASCLSEVKGARMASHDRPGDDVCDELTKIDLVIALEPIGKATARAISLVSTLWGLATGEGPRLADSNFGFWEMFGKEGVSNLSLVEVTPDGCAIVAESFLQIQYCYCRNKAFLQEKSVPLILRELRRLAATQDQSRLRRSDCLALTPQKIGAADFANYLITLIRALAPKAYKALLRRAGAKFNRWSLFVGEGEFSPEKMPQAREVELPVDEFWADPFFFRREGAEDIYVFYEAYEFSRGLGKVSVGRLKGDQIEYIGDALIRPYHLSYPFVFEYENGVYMIPETAQNRQIEIWRAESYPLQWSLHKIVMVGQSCADTTIFQHGGAWWMFTNLSEDGFDDHCSELYAFKVDSPMLNEIIPHKLNPIVTDARTARNAGRIAVRDGKLTRVAQNNAYHYGYGFSLMEITELSLERYKERQIYAAKPGFVGGVTSTHQMDQLDGIHIFDGLREFG